MNKEQKVSVFYFCGRPIRVIRNRSVDWFPVVDIRAAFELPGEDELLQFLDRWEWGVVLLEQQEELVCVDESGFYALAFLSKRPEAQEFRRFATSALLCTLRKMSGDIPKLSSTEFEGLRSLLFRNLPDELRDDLDEFLDNSLRLVPEPYRHGTEAQILHRFKEYFGAEGITAESYDKAAEQITRAVVESVARCSTEYKYWPYTHFPGRCFWVLEKAPGAEERP